MGPVLVPRTVNSTTIHSPPSSLHTFLVGQPFRLKHLRAALEHIAEHRDDVWLARPEDVAAHVMSLPEGTVPGSATAAD